MKATACETLKGRDAITYEYGPFGEVVRASGTMAGINPFQWSTKYMDQETGLSYYGFRYYQPETGRWIKRDPIGIRGGINLYDYVLNNPTNMLDRFGLDGTWTITVNNKVGWLERPVINAHYDMGADGKKCCKTMKITRTGWGGAVSSSDDDPDGGYGTPYTGANSSADQPGGILGHGPQFTPLTVHFTWTAVCLSGCCSGKVLSTTTRTFTNWGWNGKLTEP